MINERQKQEYYEALVNKDAEYENIFFVAVKTTGIFCRPTCPARKPKFENCEFYKTTTEALENFYRPCQRCKPLSYPNQISDLVRTLSNAIESNPAKRWKNSDLNELSVDASTVRRQFKKHFGMTFVEYARNKRMGIAMKQIQEGAFVIDAQLDSGYESSSGFRNAFSKIIGGAPTKFNEHLNILKAAWLDTPLGAMLAVSDEKLLYLLEFVDRRGLEREIEKLRVKTKSAIIPGNTKPILSIEHELKLYFNGALKKFDTPICLIGSEFQKIAWQALINVPYGKTRSYLEQAKAIGKHTAYRAVANANGANQLAIIIPCHRIINSNGGLGGYGGKIYRKRWLIDHERQFMAN